MCRAKALCAVLGDRPEFWSTRAPLLAPPWFNAQIDAFAAAVQAAALGDKRKAVEHLATVKSTDLRVWYVEHGQMSGRFRVRGRRLPVPQAISPSRDAQRSPDAFAKQLFLRDGHLCRYCGVRVVPKQVLAAFAAVVGVKVFCATGTNEARHGVVLAFRANVDYVVPWKLGGPTNPDNLVTACWSCNYGKAGYTIEQLGIEDPRKFGPYLGEWDGLLSSLIGLQKHAAA